MFSVPLYFQVTERVSNTEAGAHLFPAVFGNTISGILSGIAIQRYDLLCICSSYPRPWAHAVLSRQFLLISQMIGAESIRLL